MPTFEWNDTSGRHCSVTIDYNPTASSVKVSVKVDGGDVFSSTDVAVKWDKDTLDNFIRDVSDYQKWVQQIFGVVTTALTNPTKLPDALNNLPVAITKLSNTELQIRVGYPPNTLVDIRLKLDTTKVEPPKPTGPLSTLLKVGARVTLVPSNFQNMRVGHLAFGLNNRPLLGTDQFKKDCTFIVEKGLDGADLGYLSFRSVNYKKFYVNHFAFAVNISVQDSDPVYKKNASFLPEPGANGGETVNLRSLNFPKQVVRHLAHRLLLNPQEKTPQFNADCSFKVIEGLWTGPEQG